MAQTCTEDFTKIARNGSNHPESGAQMMPPDQQNHLNCKVG